RELHPLPAGQRTADLEPQIREVEIASPAFAEIVEDHESALHEIRVQVRDVLVGRMPSARLGHVAHGILEQQRIAQLDEYAPDHRTVFDEWPHRSDVTQDL